MTSASAWRPIAEAGENETDGRDLLLRGRVDADDDFGRRVDALRDSDDPEIVVTVGRYSRNAGWTVWSDGPIAGDGDTQTRTQTRTRWSHEGWSPDWLTVTHFMEIPR